MKAEASGELVTAGWRAVPSSRRRLTGDISGASGGMRNGKEDDLILSLLWPPAYIPYQVKLSGITSHLSNERTDLDEWFSNIFKQNPQ